MLYLTHKETFLWRLIYKQINEFLSYSLNLIEKINLKYEIMTSLLKLLYKYMNCHKIQRIYQ